MDHDIQHCTGIGCPLKKECLRYLAHKEIKKSDIGLYQYLSFIHYNYETENCSKIIWKEK